MLIRVFKKDTTAITFSFYIILNLLQLQFECLAFDKSSGNRTWSILVCGACKDMCDVS